MREFIDFIFQFIGQVSINDDEWEMVETDNPAYTQELYKELGIVLSSRESISNAQARLTALFIAAGAITPAEVIQNSKSNIFIGAGLW